jgi:hypothetical protein
VEECRLCPIFVTFTLAFALQQEKEWKNLSQSKNTAYLEHITAFPESLYEFVYYQASEL